MNKLIVRLAKCAQALESANMVHDASILDAVLTRLSFDMDYMRDTDHMDLMNDAHDEMRHGTSDTCEGCGHRASKGSGEVEFDPETGQMLCTECLHGGGGGFGDVDDIDHSPQGYL